MFNVHLFPNKNDYDSFVFRVLKVFYIYTLNEKNIKMTMKIKSQKSFILRVLKLLI